MKLVNFTPHPVNLYYDNPVDAGPVNVIPPSGRVARISTIELGTQKLGLPAIGITGPEWLSYEMVQYGHIEGLPPFVPGTRCIVSLVAALAARGRDDLLAPYLEVRNVSGTVIGCRYLQKVC